MVDLDEARRRMRRLARLRQLGLQRGAANLPSNLRKHDIGSAPASAAIGGPLAVKLPGEAIATQFGPAWVRTERYPLAQHPEYAAWLRVPSAALAALSHDSTLQALDPAAVAFVDTETTGLSLDTGTYTFLIGVGTYDLSAEAEPFPAEVGLLPPARLLSSAFVVRQFFMRSPAEERAQLHLLQQLLDRCTGIVSFNGRGFDMPLITNRFVLAQLPPPLSGAPHLDLLPPARRLWRAQWGSCRLGHLERNVLGLERAADDVPGYLIPDIYRQYYRSGIVTDMLARVFYHNLQDILSLPLLATRMGGLFQGKLPELDKLPPLECLSLGRCYAALTWTEASIAAYQAALQGPLPLAAREQVLCELSFLYKRTQQRDLAVALWEEWISTLPGEDLTPYIELAKHHEWHTGDLDAAHGWAAWALRISEGAAHSHGLTLVQADLRQRLARLERKLAGMAAEDSVPED